MGGGVLRGTEIKIMRAKRKRLFMNSFLGIIVPLCLCVSVVKVFQCLFVSVVKVFKCLSLSASDSVVYSPRPRVTASPRRLFSLCLVPGLRPLLLAVVAFALLLYPFICQAG